MPSSTLISSNDQLDIIVDDASEIDFIDPLLLDDLIHMDQPMTEHSVVQILQERFMNQKYFVSFVKFVKIYICLKSLFFVLD